MVKIDIQVLPDGRIRSIYDDTFANMIVRLGEIYMIKRLSNVEYENGGWTVRSAKNPKLAIRQLKGKVGVYKTGKIMVYYQRKQALEAERLHAWELI